MGDNSQIHDGGDGVAGGHGMSAHMSQELVRVIVDDLHREDGWRGESRSLVMPSCTTCHALWQCAAAELSLIIVVELGQGGKWHKRPNKVVDTFHVQECGELRKDSGAGMHRGMTGTLISWPAHSAIAGICVGKTGRFTQWVVKMKLWAGWQDEKTANISFKRTLETGSALMPARTQSMLKKDSSDNQLTSRGISAYSGPRHSSPS
ncbi:hypothetical protein EV702DRAFT_1047115 [Suillus placidus]|uniref:Uncharacterized protein n=1 Tax=Suillus placidus TaxID=48579 RepID=A0A9P7D168_9AGAM|nr:hypothetical protein EV702DRAFT_1047115 [Suillus placidus]